MRVSNSPLVTYTNLSRNHSGRRTEPITKIAIHHMYAVWSGKRCADYFATTKRQASSNYCIGVNGDIAMSVEEKNRAWTTSSNWCDQRAVTIEVANSSLSGDTPVSAASMKSLIALVADICKRNGIKKCTYTGDKSGVLQMHKWYASTSCPGKYLGSRFSYIAEEVNKLLAPKPTTTKPKAPTQPKTTSFKPYTVAVSTPVLNVRAGAGMGYKVNRTVKADEVYTIVEEKDGWGKLKSGAGWISLAYTKKTTVKTTAKKVDIDKLAREVIAGKYGNGEQRKKTLGSHYSQVQKRVNELLK